MTSYKNTHNCFFRFYQSVPFSFQYFTKVCPSLHPSPPSLTQDDPPFIQPCLAAYSNMPWIAARSSRSISGCVIVSVVVVRVVC
jgi:hypothetical protein